MLQIQWSVVKVTVIRVAITYSDSYVNLQFAFYCKKKESDRVRVGHSATVDSPEGVTVTADLCTNFFLGL